MYAEKLRKPSQKHLEIVQDAYDSLNKLLEKNNWLAGDHPTIADFHLIANTTTIELLIPIDDDKFPKLASWMKKVKALPCYDANEAGLEQVRAMVKNYFPN
jgi:glutathione S-transferase